MDAVRPAPPGPRPTTPAGPPNPAAAGTTPASAPAPEPSPGAAPTASPRALAPLAENVAESTAACLVAMVQGNVLALSMAHWAVASQTGVLAGMATSAALLATRAPSRARVALTLGVATSAADAFVHPGGFGIPGAEAVATGAVAAGLSWIAGALLARRGRGTTGG